MESIVIIADDLTGAADTAVQFCPFFDDTRLVSHQKMDRILSADLPPARQAAAIYTNSRALAAEAAHQRLDTVARALKEIKTLQIYKKIDSCMRGNVGAECDALLDRLEFEAGFITPAFPEMGRTTKADIHHVHGVPLNETEISQDPVTPVTESSLSRIMGSQSRFTLGHVGLDCLESGLDRLVDDIEGQLQNGVRHFVFDVTCRVHLDRIAELIFALEHRILPVGSAGLAGSLANRLEPKPVLDVSAGMISPAGFNLLICGTTSAVTARQIDELDNTYSYETFQLNPGMLADQSHPAEFAETVSRVRHRLGQKDVILSIRPPANRAGGMRSTCQAQQAQPSADSTIGGLGRFVAEVVTHIKPGNLFLTGGDTADAVLAATETEGIRIRGEVVAGVVQGVIIGGVLDSVPVVTKAGAFGDPVTLVAVHGFWQRTEDR